MAAASKRFDELGVISAETLEVLASLGFTTATPVQEATIPLFLGHKDVAVDACTGSGKTLAFLVPLVDKIRKLDEPPKKGRVLAMIITPTRELAKQIHEVADPFFASIPGLKTMLLVGGTDPVADAAACAAAGPHVLVGTPGRLADVAARGGGLDFRCLEVLVLDEADRLLDMGFRGHLDQLIARLPRQRRTGLFSATQTEAVGELARAGLRNPVRVAVSVTVAPGAGNRGGPAGPSASAPPSCQRTPASLRLHYVTLPVERKLGELLALLHEQREQKVIVYFLTCACVDFYAAALPRVAGGLPPLRALHGRMKQPQREATLAAFATSMAGALLCTDVAARGLDIPDVAWTVQFDAPQDPDAFVHRAGRSARMGRAGRGLVLLGHAEAPYVEFLRLRKVPLEEAVAHEGVPDMLVALRALAEREREVMEKGARAFVSYVRGYKEHQCRFIFRLQDLDLGRLATAFGLLRLPRMPELRGVRVEGFTPSTVNPASVKYKDKAREKLRQKLLQQRAAQAEAQATQAQTPATPPHQKPARRLPALKRRTLEARQDEANFASEYRLLRKVKRGKLTEDEFDAAIGLAAPVGHAPEAPTEACEPKSRAKGFDASKSRHTSLRLTKGQRHWKKQQMAGAVGKSMRGGTGASKRHKSTRMHSKH